MNRQAICTLFAGIVILVGLSITPVQAQQILTIALPTFAEALVDEAVVDDFEAQYGVQVEFVYDFNPPNANNAPTTPDGVESYAEDLAEYMSAADVLLVDNFLTPEVTRAGYALDLTPLISADGLLNPGDFYNAVWQSFMWDGGQWAMPIASQPLFIDYNTAAFDEAGLAYPNQNWTIDDFAFAARELTTYDETGAVLLPGLVVNNTTLMALLRALSGNGFYDNTVFPDSPLISNSQLAFMLDTWAELSAEGVVRLGGGGFGGQADEIPMQLGSGGDFSITFTDEESGEENELTGGNFQDDAPVRALAPLPNGEAILLTTGLAVSSGSSMPDMAYNLARFLSEQQAFAELAIGSEPARRTYFSEFESDATVTLRFGSNRTEQEIALITEALEEGIPTAELRFGQYIASALTDVQAGVTDSVSALQEAELDAIETIQAMTDLDVNLTVTAGAPIEVAADEVIIDFGLQSFIQPLPNQSEWDDAIADFVAGDPEVGAVDLDIINIARGLLGGLGNTDTYDCTYYSNTLFTDIDSEVLLALDPLLYSDPNYDVNDLPFGALQILQIGGFTYGLPITIQPQLLQYNPDSFAQAGLPEPLGGWTISEFGNALELLSFVVEEDTAPFIATGFDNTYLVMLAAAQGGLPIDVRTTPPTIDFTSPESITAIQSILDWVDAGYIDQGSPENFGGDGPGSFGDTTTPITPTFFAGFSNPERSLTTYPTGTRYTPVSFDVGAGYISIDTDVPEACFRWLSFISRRPGLFTGAMPAQISLLDTPEFQAALSVQSREAYRTFADLMSRPDAINFNNTDPFLGTWLQRAMETYLTDGGELRPLLEDAEIYTNDYIACTANIELELSIRVVQQITQCVEDVDSAALSSD